MAVLAGVAVSTDMYVINRMTTGAGRRCIGERVVPVAVVTAYERVISRQPIACRIMIKLGVLPLCICVTAIALFAKAAGVRVIVSMTADARKRRIAESLPWSVAVSASRGTMSARQYEVGPAMVEQAGVGGPDIGIPALMVGVAGNAFVLLRGRESAVQTVLRPPVGTDVFVTTGT